LSRKLDEAGAGYVIGEVASVLDPDEVVRPAEYERRDTDGR
jgi:hypothetical protein